MKNFLMIGSRLFASFRRTPTAKLLGFLKFVLRSGRIVYTNDLPIYTAFDAGAVRFPGSFTVDVPTRLNEMLLAGRLDLSPISAFFYARHADAFALLPDLCIGSRREALSVLLVSARPLEALAGATIAVTTESASGRNLLRVLLEGQYGIRAAFAETEDPLAAVRRGEPTLLIGDRAIDAHLECRPERIHDLGLLWSAWTGLDMVYAVWAVRRKALSGDSQAVFSALDALREARAWGVANGARVIAAAQAKKPRSAGFYASYYEALNFTFDDRARAGFARYCAELLAIGALSSVPSLESEVSLVCR
jgi:chorismate dehydratase